MLKLAKKKAEDFLLMTTQNGRGRKKKVDVIAVAMCQFKLRSGFFWIFDAMWEVQNGVLLYAVVSGCSLQRAEGRMPSHKRSFKEWLAKLQLRGTESAGKKGRFYRA